MTNHDCWNWDGAKSRGRGELWDKEKKKPVLAHRFYYEKLVGPIPDGFNVCHTCDNPRCVRPDHLFLGTQADNLRDMTEKGRRRCNNPLGKNSGETNGMHKLTWPQVDEIRARYIPYKVSMYKLAQEFGVNYATIWTIINGRNWKR